MQQSPSGPFRDADFLHLWKPILGCIRTDLSKPNTHFLRFGCDVKDYLRTIPDFCNVSQHLHQLWVLSAQFRKIHERIQRRHILQNFTELSADVQNLADFQRIRFGKVVLISQYSKEKILRCQKKICENVVEKQSKKSLPLCFSFPLCE